MSKVDLGLAINAIGMLVDDETFHRIKAHLDTIEEISIKLFDRIDELEEKVGIENGITE